jgi:hypothetical protein
VVIYNARTATAWLPPDDVATFATALLPIDDDGLRAVAGAAVADREQDVAPAVALAVEAIAESLDGTTLSRDELHEALRQRLPPDLLPWCPGCKSHHARRGLLVLAGLHGRLCLTGRAGRQPVFARTDQTIAWNPPPREQAGAELVRRYLNALGPSTPAHFAQWAGLGTRHARELWSLGELAEVRIDGEDRAWLNRDDLAGLDDAPKAPGVRLLAPGDPLLLGRDRARLLAEPAQRKQVWRAVGGAGVVLADGAPAGLWRARKRGRALAVTLDAFAAVDREALMAELERLAPHRNAITVELA